MAEFRPLSSAEKRAEEFRNALVNDAASTISGDYILKQNIRRTIIAEEKRSARKQARTLRQLAKLAAKVNSY